MTITHPTDITQMVKHGEELRYGGYTISPPKSEDGTLWLVVCRPSKPGLQFRLKETGTPEDALAAAKKRIDKLNAAIKRVFWLLSGWPQNRRWRR